MHDRVSPSRATHRSQTFSSTVTPSSHVGTHPDQFTPAVDRDFSQTAIRQSSPVTLLPKLRIDPVDSPLEREADRVAAAVMRSPDSDFDVSTGSRTRGIQRKCDTCKQEDDEQEGFTEEKPIQRSPSNIASADLQVVQRKCTSCDEEEDKENALHRAPNGNSPSYAPQLVHQVISQPGRPLPASTRSFFESRMNADFSSVRIHDSSLAAESASSINARAYTVGNAIAFASGQFSPHSKSGRFLLAHELTHTLQQRIGSGIPSTRMIRKPFSSQIPRSRPAIGVFRTGISLIQRTADGSFSTADNTAPMFGPPAPDKVSESSAEIKMSEGIESVSHRGVLLAADEQFLRAVLQNMIRKDGSNSTVEFIATFRMRALSKAYHLMTEKQLREYSTNPRIAEDISWNRIARAIRPILEKVDSEIQNENQQFLKDFESKAKSVAELALDESEKHVLAEAVRYGVNLNLEYSFFGGTRIGGDVADNASTRGIAIAAQGLLDRKKKVNDAQHEFQRFAGAMGSPSAKQRSMLQDHEINIHLSELNGEITQTRRDLDIFRMQVQIKFPLLAALSSDDEFKRSELEDLAKATKGKNADSTAVIVDQVVEKLKNISKTKNGLKPGGDINIWRVPSIIESTKSELGATPDSVRGRIVDEKIKSERPNVLTEILIGILQLGLVLLAPLTEGLTLIPAAAISTAVAYQHFKEYETKKALHGTDFGAAALSAEDPSLFWLAIDIVGAGFDVTAAGGPAFRLFRELAPAAKAVRGAQAGEDAVRALERSAGELGGEAFARRVGAHARELQSSAGKQIGITAEEARKFEQAATDVAVQELREGVQTAETLAGGKVSVSRSGGIFSCSSPCTMVRERYKNMLVREQKYAQRLNELESRARNLPHGTEGDIARKQIANEAAALEREMRTTALLGDWTSPLKDTSEFDALVKKRGSVAAELDHHPLGWSGKDEARFRYGKDLEPEKGYRWTLDENGGLRYDRLDANLPPRRFNSASGVFEEAAEEGLIRATRGPEVTRELAKLPQKEREAIEAAFKKRSDLIADRDRLEALQEAGTMDTKDGEKLKKLYAEINEQSRQLGEEAAEGVMRNKGGKKLYPSGKKSSTSGDFDQVWKVGEEFQIVEAKGGSGGLGSRAVGEGVRAEQGTIAYAKNIAENMSKSGATKEIRELGRQLRIALEQGKVKYVLVRAPVGTEAGASVLRDAKVSEFVLSK